MQGRAFPGTVHYDALYHRPYGHHGSVRGNKHRRRPFGARTESYNENWSYVWGGTSPGAVDCSGLIYSYNGVGGIRTDMLAASPEWGYVSSGIPRIHGLGLHHPGHVGVYVGSGMAIDARSSYDDMVYESVYNMNWVEWFKVFRRQLPDQRLGPFQRRLFLLRKRAVCD